MLKFTCVVLLVIASVSCIPIESETSKAGLVRPSPINPDVVSEPLPDEASTTTSSTQATIRETHIQKIPARGTKLSATLDQDKPSTTSSPKEKRETETVATTPAKSNFRRDQPATTTSSHKQSGVSTTTAEPVSLKTPIVHPSGLKVRRSADDATTSKPTTTTRGPLPTSGSSSSSNSNNDDDNSGPHFVRPVPVDQILKNLHEAAPQHHGAAHHAADQAKAVEATTAAASSEGTTVNDHKFHRKTKTTTTTEAPEEPEEQEQVESHEDDKDKETEEDSKQ